MDKNTVDLIRRLAKEQRLKKHSSLGTLYKYLSSQLRFQSAGEFLMAKAILEGYISTGDTFGLKEFRNLLYMLPHKIEGDCCTRKVIREMFKAFIKTK